MFSKKKSLHLESISDSAIFPRKSRCSLKKKKKRSSLRFHPWFPYFILKIKGFSKKKVFTSICCCISLFFSQNHGDLQKLKFKIPRPPLSPFATHPGVGTPSLKSPGLDIKEKKALDSKQGTKRKVSLVDKGKKLQFLGFFILLLLHHVWLRLFCSTSFAKD